MNLKPRFFLIFGLCICVLVGAIALAADNRPTVIFDGKTNTFSFRNTTETDLFSSFKEIMPGQTKTQQIILQGENLQEAVSFYLRADTHESDRQALEPLVLTVRKNGNDIETNAATNSLLENVFLGTFEKDGTVILEVELKVPTSVGNELADASATIQWIFTAQMDDGGYSPGDPSKPVLSKDNHLAYIIGYEDGTVRPLDTITRAEVATIFFRLLTDDSRAFYWSQENPFPDVTADMWCNNAISTMYNAGIITGYSDGTFNPYAPVTRAEFTAIAARFSNEVSDGVSEFFDVSEDYWAFEYIALAEDLGWVQGHEGYFRPQDNMTRAEVMTTINRVLERSVRKQNMLKDTIQWPDNDPDEWYYEAVQEATNSHECNRTNEQVYKLNFYYEAWTKLIENPDWAALERTWSQVDR